MWPCGSVHEHERRRQGTDTPARRRSRSPPTPNWRRCPATSCSSSAASSTASRSSTRTSGGRSPAPRPRSAPSGRWRIGFCWAAFRAWRCLWCSCSGRGSTSRTGRPGELLYSLATPLYGLTFGLSILAIGIGAVLFQKKFIPEEITIQDRHDGRSPEISARPSRPTSPNAGESTLKRRKLMGCRWASASARSVRHARRVHRRPDQEPVEAGGSDRDGKKAVLWTSGGPRDSTARPSSWPAPPETPATERLRQDAPRGHRRRRHGDRVPVAGVRRRRHHHRVAPPAHRDPDGRPQPGDAHPHQAGRHQGGQAQGSGELQLRRPVRLHQGVLAFVAPLRFTSSRPIASSARATSRSSTRCTSQAHIRSGCARLAQLPITIDQDGYLVANGDFIEPVGPAFWERRS